MPAKQRVLELISALPESVSYEEILQTLSILFSDNKASDDIKNGCVYTTETAKQRVRAMVTL